MNRTPPTRFEPSTRLLRGIFAAIALTATIATADFIDALAHGRGTSAQLTVQAAPAVILARR